MKQINLNNLKNLNLSIRAKITILAGAGILFLAIVGAVGILSLQGLGDDAVVASSKDYTSLRLLKTITEAQHYFQSQVQEWKDTLLRGNDPALYAKHWASFEKYNASVDQELNEARELAAAANRPDLISVKSVDELRLLHSGLHQTYVEAVKSYNPAHPAAGQEVDRMVRGMDRPFTEAVNKLAASIALDAKTTGDAMKTSVVESSRTAWITLLVVLLIAAPLMIAASLLIARNIIHNLDAFQGTIAAINQGDFTARARTDSGDELALLAQAFNDLLDSRVSTLAQIEKENEKLNESVITLLQTVAQLARKDLTVHIPVSEDVTGAVSDALNLFARETARVLQDVTNISADVTSASLAVQKQSDDMLLTAAEERKEVDSTAQSLASAAQAMRDIARLAQHANLAADNAIRTTQTALSTVTDTVNGINATRDVIRETEKRIKRLGERSQEISGAVNLINVISERTHILALNASMHAASAGEAGRGFAVVADEVQRLAENSRQATQQIAALVHNIQVETADAVNIMNDVITQIVEGSRLAEQAGQQMHSTQETTSDLVASVKQIAASSEQQIRVGQELVELASALRISSEVTSEKLLEQSAKTNNLVDYAKHLLESVRVFKLPV